MNPHRLKDLDRVILQHCEADFVPLQELVRHVPRATLYRHSANLLDAGLLGKRGRAYRTTEQGKRRLADLLSHVDWNLWDHIYSPMQYVPTREHRATLELMIAAAVARQTDHQQDHHPGFVLMGPTLAWKTSAAKFGCLMLGVSSSETIIDLTAESGRSLFIRRDGKGNLAFKRDLLDGPLIVFDDFLEVDASLRPTVHHFLSGRTIVPVDNAIVHIAPVSLLTLNPRARATLEEQTSLSTAQLRRLVVTNLATVAFPDLAKMGHHALAAAAGHGSLTLHPPTADVATWRPQIVDLVRDILVPEAVCRVDTEMVIVMATGMTGFIPDVAAAVRQTVYDYAITAETLGWARPGWIELVSRFALDAPSRARIQAPVPHLDRPASAEDHIIIRRSAMEHYNQSALPPFAISEEHRARMIAIAVDEHIAFDRALEIVLDYYLQLKERGLDLDELHSVMALAKDLRERSIPVKNVTLALKLRKACRDGNYTPEEFDSALDLLPVLRAHGFAPSDDRTESALRLAARLLHSPRALADLDEWLNEKTS